MTFLQAVAGNLGRIPRLWNDLDINLRKMILIGFVEAGAVNAYISVLMPWYRSLGFASDAVGGLDSLLQVVVSVTALSAGVMADRLGRKRLFVLGQVVRCAAVVALLVVRSYWGIIATVVLRGLVTISSPASSALMAGFTARRNRATILGVKQTLYQLASVITPLAAGFLADGFGVKIPFAAGLALSLLALFMSLSIEEPAPNGSVTGIAERPQGEPILLRIRGLFAGDGAKTLSLLLAASVVNGLANGSTNILLPFTVMDRFSDSYGTMAGVLSAGALGTMLVLLIGGRIADLKGRRFVILTSGIVFPLLIMGAYLSVSIQQLTLSVLFVTMVGNISSPAIQAIYMEAVGEQDRATFAGLNTAFVSAGQALGAVAAGFGDKANPTWAWIATIAAFASQTLFYHLAVSKDS